MTTETSDRTRSCKGVRWGGVGRSLLYVLFLVAGVLAALQMHEFLSRRQSGERTASSVARFSPAASQEAEALWDSPRSSPASLAGAEPMEGDPKGIAPPPRAVRQSALKLSDGAVVATYVWQGEPASAEEYYQDALRKRGWTFQGRRTSPSGGRLLIFRQGSGQIVVSLRNDRPEAKMCYMMVAAIQK